MNDRQRFTRVELAVGVLAAALLTLMVVSCKPQSRFAARGNITRGISNCRQIVLALKLYASDHHGKYPDAHLTGTKTANAAFRLMFEKEVIDSEAIFGCPESPFEPDGVIEDPYIGPVSTRFGKAVTPGENHWAMTAGVTDAMQGGIPLVYENPVSATWPPKWNADAKAKPVRGRSWTTGIIVGMNDGSASIQPLASSSGSAVGLKPDPATGKDAFEAAIDAKEFPKGEVLDVE